MFPSSVRSLSVLAAFIVASFSLTSPLAADPGPTPRASTGDLLEVDAGLSHGYLPAEETSQFHTRIRVEADDVRVEERAPLNLAVVIDRSGSMRGGRLEQAKRAARRLVDRLSTEDRLAVVAYGSSVEVPAGSWSVDSENRGRLKSAIDSIRRRGSTFLSGGYEKGRSIVERHATEASIDRVILMSDGKANRGIESPDALGSLAESSLETGVSTTTMGVGLDYDESIMTALAERGSGNHYFIEDEEKIASMFGQEFEGLAGVVGRDAYVVLELGEGIELLDVHGFSHRRSEGNVVIGLGSFYARQQQDVLVELAASAEGEKRRPVVDVNLHFDDVTGDTDRKVTNRVSLAALGTGDSAKQAQTNNWVMKRVEQIEYARNVERASQAYERGDRDEANEIIDEQKERLDRAAQKYDFDESKVEGKLRDLETKKSTMGRSSSSSDDGKRLQKESAGESLEIKKKSSAF